MDMKKLIGMAVVLVLLAGAAIWQRKGQEIRHSLPASADATLLQGVDLNTLTGLEVAQSSNHVALAKKNGQWTVESLYGYPADFNRLADALLKLADVKPGNPVRAGNVAASEFGLDDNAKTITLKTGDGKSVATVTIGARRKTPESAGWANQFFVRKDDGDSVYLVDYDFRPFSEKPADWISKELLKVQSGDLVSVKEGNVSLKLDGAEWTLADLNKETEEFQSSEANRLRSALQYLSCTTVADPAKTDMELGFDKPSVYVAQTKDGFTYTVKLGAKTDEGQFVRIAADYTRPAPPVAPEGDDAAKKETYSKELDAYNNMAAANADKADKLNAQFSKWTYVISSYAADGLLIPRDKLVKPKEEKKDHSAGPDNP
ncbi:MAG: DUF4340 domain-containing protein [Kiritimatiellales bacterium]